jgi:hypothetical protein
LGAIALTGGSALTALAMVLGAMRIRLGPRTLGPLLVTSGLVALAVTWLVAQWVPGWNQRYTLVLVGPVLLGLVGVAVRSELRRVVSACVLVLVGVTGVWTTYTDETIDKNILSRALVKVRDEIAPGDVVVAGGDTLPIVYYYLGAGPQYFEFASLPPVTDPTVYDYRDSTERLKRADGLSVIRAVVSMMRPGQRMLFVDDVLDSEPETEWWRQRDRVKTLWRTTLQEEPRLRPLDVAIYTAKDLDRRSRSRMNLLGLRIYERLP